MVERMAKAPRAQDRVYGPNRPMVVELQYDGRDSHTLHGLTKRIDDAISQGCAVLVRGWEPTPVLQFTLGDIKLLLPTVSQEVVAEGMYLRSQVTVIQPITS